MPPLSGSIFASLYSADGAATTRDYGLNSYFGASKPPSFEAQAFALGSFVTLDVTETYNTAIAAGESFLGLQLRTGMPLRHFATFDNFELSVAAVPEPETYALLLAGLVLLGERARQVSKRSRSPLATA